MKMTAKAELIELEGEGELLLCKRNYWLDVKASDVETLKLTNLRLIGLEGHTWREKLSDSWLCLRYIWTKADSFDLMP